MIMTLNSQFKNSSKSDSPDPCGFTGEVHGTCKEELAPVLHDFFKKIEKEALPIPSRWWHHLGTKAR
jgi:hypothetical protein